MLLMQYIKYVYICLCFDNNIRETEKPLQFRPPFPLLALIYTSLSKRREVAQHLHLTPSLMVSRYTTLAPPLTEVVNYPSALVREGGTCHLVKKERRQY